MDKDQETLLLTIKAHLERMKDFEDAWISLNSEPKKPSRTTFGLIRYFLPVDQDIYDEFGHPKPLNING